jgi:hypothetical protein
MGIGNTSPNTVYYDAEEGQYYTANSPMHGMQNPFLRDIYGGRNYIGSSMNRNDKNSMVNDNIARAKAAYDAVVSGMSSNPAYNQSAMFPGMTMPLQQSLGQVDMSSGAGRFLGGNAPVMGTQQMNYGYTPQQSALLSSLMNPGMNMTSGANQGMGGMATPQFSINTQA